MVVGEEALPRADYIASTYDILRFIRGIAEEETRWQRFRLRERVGPVGAVCGTGQHECRQQTQVCPNGGSSATSFRHSLVSRALCENEKKSVLAYKIRTNTDNCNRTNIDIEGIIITIITRNENWKSCTRIKGDPDKNCESVMEYLLRKIMS